MARKSEQIKNKQQLVQRILEQQPETRTNDMDLVVEYWKTQQPMLVGFGTAGALCAALIKGQLASPDDITRARRKVTEQHPHLRGTKHKYRMEAEEDVRANINTV